MAKLGIIGGSGLLSSDLIKDFTKKIINIPYNRIEYYEKVCEKTKNQIYFIQRHGLTTPPHKINHKDHILAMESLGVNNIIGISSTGSLKKSIVPGDFVVLHDFIQLGKIMTFFNNELIFNTPQISESLRNLLISTLKKHSFRFHEKGVYINTHGPRYETCAEINMFKNYADIVGMTLGNEVTLACEKKINYAALCTVDNYANGISDDLLTQENMEQLQKLNHDKLKQIVNSIILNFKEGKK